MAPESSLRTMDAMNPCCTQWRTRYSKMEEKRNALRQGVEILKGQIDRLQQENLNLKKACDEEKSRATVIEKEKGNEANLRISLEKEIAALKSEISSINPEIVSGNEALDKEITLLRTCISEREVEIDRFKLLLTEEKRRVDEERKSAEFEKKKTVELQKSLEYEKSRAAEVSKTAEETRVQLVALKNEVEKTRSKCEEAKKVNPELVSGNEDLDKEIRLLQTCISEREGEIDRLKLLLTEEKRRADVERKGADTEKKKAVELRKSLEYEKSRATEASKMADASGKIAEDARVQLEALKNEIEKTRLKYEEANKMLEEEKQKANKEKKLAEKEKARLVEQRRIVEEYEKKVTEEKCHANKLLMQLEEEKQKVEKLQKEIQEVKLSGKFANQSEVDEIKRNLEAEKKKVAREKKRADMEMSKTKDRIRVAETSDKKAMEEKCRAEKLSEELQSSRQRIKNLEEKLYEMNGMLEAERKKVATEKKHTHAEKLISDEHGRLAVENEKRATEEKCRADKLFQELENDRRKLQGLENEISQLKLGRNLAGASIVSPPVVVKEQSIVNLLREQLKFEKKRVKHAKEVVKLEKSRSTILQQQLHRLREDFDSMLRQLDMLSNTFGSRNGLNHFSKKSGLANMQSVQLPGRMLGHCPSQMYLYGDSELRMSSLSSMDTSCFLKPNTEFVRTGHRMESSSGMETLLDPPRRETLRSSALNSNTASFSDEQLVGSQEKVAGSFTTSTVLPLESTKPQAKKDDGVKVGIVAENGMIKRRKVLTELESIKHMHSEGKRIFEVAEEKLSALHSTLVDRSNKKRKVSHEPDTIVQQKEMNKRESLNLASTKTRENSQALQYHKSDLVKSNQNAEISVEQVINGDYMKLLDLDNAVDEEYFRIAMESPLSPTLPELDLHDSETGVGAKVLSLPISATDEAGDQPGGPEHNENQLYCIVLSDMEDSGCINRIFCATRSCLSRCNLFLQTNWLVQDILAALVLEKDLRPREKVCVLFSLILLNFSVVSSSKSIDFRNLEILDSFSSHIHSVLSNVDTRNRFSEICDFSELLGLIEEFILCRRILLQKNATSESLNGSGSGYEILHEGKKDTLCPETASTNLIMAGSIIFASIFKAIGWIGSICEVSFNVLLRYRAEYSLAIMVPHIFAYICKEEYFTVSNYSLVMKVVKSMVAFYEGDLANHTHMDVQPGDNTQPRFSPCVKCPFSEGSVPLDDLSSMLLEEMRNYCLGHTRSPYTESVSCILGNVVSSLELIASTKGWEWTRSKIVPQLFKMLESCDLEGIYSVALVALLGELGRLGVEAGGYDDAGVESIKCRLSDVVRQVETSKCSTPLHMAVISALITLYPKGHEAVFMSGHPDSSVSQVIRNCISSLSREQLSPLFGVENQFITAA